MSISRANQGTGGNATLLQMEGAVDPDLWEPHTTIVVVIFGLVCVLHLTAFLYTVCLQSYVSAGANTFSRQVHDGRQDKNVFYGLVSPLLIGHNDPQQKERTPIMIDM
ncbi:hypothetical protein GDO81_009137 [Engystomops pustulosus]|uniref:Uncharacterized protein n=1 Tax=Engystomops pustulosus TaxID=76066 RepID=A0AAV7BNS3_ENGPU|nr:hypothetical protein GDO81_009137 [Engystomops pustulosus]